MNSRKKTYLFTILSIFLFFATTTVYGANATRIETAVRSRIFFQDNFDRPDSDTVGLTWVEAVENETSSIYNDIYVGAGHLAIDNESLVFHYVNHPQKTAGAPGAASSNWRPIAISPLEKPARRFPVQTSFNFTPHEDARIYHTVGLMMGEDGFYENTEPLVPFSLPNTGIGVEMGRTNSAFSNSQITIYWFEDGTSTRLSVNPTSFQFVPNETYSVNFIVDRQAAFVEISNGSVTDVFSIETPRITYTPDQLFVLDGGGGISSRTAGSGDFMIRFDDFTVSASTWQNCESPTDRRCNPYP